MRYHILFARYTCLMATLAFTFSFQLYNHNVNYMTPLFHRTKSTKAILHVLEANGISRQSTFSPLQLQFSRKSVCTPIVSNRHIISNCRDMRNYRIRDSNVLLFSTTLQSQDQDENDNQQNDILSKRKKRRMRQNSNNNIEVEESTTSRNNGRSRSTSNNRYRPNYIEEDDDDILSSSSSSSHQRRRKSSSSSSSSGNNIRNKRQQRRIRNNKNNIYTWEENNDEDDFNNNSPSTIRKRRQKRRQQQQRQQQQKRRYNLKRPMEVFINEERFMNGMQNVAKKTIRKSKHVMNDIGTGFNSIITEINDSLDDDEDDEDVDEDENGIKEVDWFYVSKNIDYDDNDDDERKVRYNKSRRSRNMASRNGRSKSTSSTTSGGSSSRKRNDSRDYSQRDSNRGSRDRSWGTSSSRESWIDNQSSTSSTMEQQKQQQQQQRQQQQYYNMNEMSRSRSRSSDRMRRTPSQTTPNRKVIEVPLQTSSPSTTSSQESQTKQQGQPSSSSSSPSKSVLMLPPKLHDDIYFPNLLDQETNQQKENNLNTDKGPSSSKSQEQQTSINNISTTTTDTSSQPSNSQEETNKSKTRTRKRRRNSNDQQKKVYSAYPINEQEEVDMNEELEEFRELYGKAAADAIDSVGNLMVDVVEGKYWDAATTSTKGSMKDEKQKKSNDEKSFTSSKSSRSKSKSKSKRRHWRDRLSERVDYALGVHEDGNYYKKWEEKIKRDRMSEDGNDPVSIFYGKQRRDHGPKRKVNFFEEDGSLMSLFFGRTPNGKPLSLSRASSTNICTTLFKTSFRYSIAALSQVCRWASCRGSLPQPIVVFFLSASALSAPRRRKMLTVAFTLIVLRTIAEAIHGYTHEDWDDYDEDWETSNDDMPTNSTNNLGK